MASEILAVIRSWSNLQLYSTLPSMSYAGNGTGGEPEGSSYRWDREKFEISTYVFELKHLVYRPTSAFMRCLTRHLRHRISNLVPPSWSPVLPLLSPCSLFLGLLFKFLATLNQAEGSFLELLINATTWSLIFYNYDTSLSTSHPTPPPNKNFLISRPTRLLTLFYQRLA